MIEPNLDPPEEDWPICPECASDAISEDGADPSLELICDDCGHRWHIEFEDDALKFDDVLELFESPEIRKFCPHNKQWHECNACMVASDLAYDAARERLR